jgi:hypothetical protein
VCVDMVWADRIGDFRDEDSKPAPLGAETRPITAWDLRTAPPTGRSPEPLLALERQTAELVMRGGEVTSGPYYECRGME